MATERTEYGRALTQLRDCRDCHLCWMGDGPVPFSGPTGEIMVLGEAPTRAEDKARRRLFNVGRSPDDPMRVLTNGLKRASLKQDELFFTNTVSCWPDGRPPTDLEIRGCMHNVSMAVKVCDPRVVLALGATALKVCNDKVGKRRRSVTAHHGQPFLCRAGPMMDRWVFPTWHPAALKRNVGAELAFMVDMADFGEFYRAMSRNDWPTGGIGKWTT